MKKVLCGYRLDYRKSLTELYWSNNWKEFKLGFIICLDGNKSLIRDSETNQVSQASFYGTSIALGWIKISFYIFI